MTWSIHMPEGLKANSERNVEDRFQPLSRLAHRLAPREDYMARNAAAVPLDGLKVAFMEINKPVGDKPWYNYQAQAIVVWHDRVERLIWAGGNWVLVE